MADEVIRAMSKIFIKLPSQQLKLVTLKPDTTVSLGKFGSFRSNHLIGTASGQPYEILEHGEIRPVRLSMLEDTLGSEDQRSNQKIEDVQTNQILNTDDIELLKKDKSLTGSDIVARVIGAHQRFEQKSAFAQQKYTRRKEEKFTRGFTACRPNVQNIVEYLLNKDPMKIHYMSIETLSLILSMADASSAGRYLVVEDVGGLVVGSLLERMGEQGEVMLLHEGEHPNLNYTTMLDLPAERVDKMVKTLDLLQALIPDEEDYSQSFQPVDEDGNKVQTDGSRRRASRREQLKLRQADFQAGNFDALILCTSLDVTTLLPHLIPAIALSGSLVIYSRFKEALLPVHAYLNALPSKQVIHIDIQDIRLRGYQVLPGRTHPLMTGRSGGGYLLTGIRVAPAEGVEAFGFDGGRRKRERSREDSGRKKSKMEDPDEESLADGSQTKDEV